ncbi:hypothetical protein NP233_g10878 [Leucocoprinus birnbaumii]|uniref:Nephrocystin 3-like N-terminal domain-containing protein n=1 Tax=Leucocoprinus birnbaumii TaxID=56174 RepID=A0AAD5VJY2_9AGAR|nr:hypothetical protein NP233_g10878 [Leucocoprinus birnbaumii]
MSPTENLKRFRKSLSRILTRQPKDKHSEYFSRTSLPPAHIALASVTSSNAQLFGGASNFAIHSMNVNVRNTAEDFEKSNVGKLYALCIAKSGLTHISVIQRLIEKGAPAAIHNSAYRAYPPRCHEETRRSMRTDLVAWTANPKRLRRMRWYLGPAGVGKSAVAQSAAEDLAPLKWLGATFCFSRPGKVDDPDTVIPTIAYQLAMKNARYKRLITETLGNDPLILSMDRATQFKALILDPFQIIAMEDETTQPLLVIIDGLDECRDPKAQCELIYLIRSEVERGERIPLLWMVCSRPEWHLKLVSANVDRPVLCQQIEISIDNDEAQQDARRILRAGLLQIRNDYVLPADWPAPEQLDLIHDAASGHLGFVSFIVRFVKENNDSDGPRERFRLCVKAVSGRGIDTSSTNPLESMDVLYHQVLSKVPSKHLPNTMRILGISILYSGHQLNVDEHALFLVMARDSFYQYLSSLHSVINIPHPNNARITPIRIYHASFSDFLRDPVRSREFRLNEGAIHHEVAIRSLSLLGEDRTHDQQTFAAQVAWDACRNVPGTLVPGVLDLLEQFDFGKMQLSSDDSVAQFIRWLYTQVPGGRPLLLSLDHIDLADPHIKMIIVVHRSDDPVKFCEVFPMETLGRATPITLHLAIGRTNRTYISLVVEQRQLHSRRKSVLPVDPSVLRDLQVHRSLLA